MYRIASKNIFAGYADSVVPIRYHPDEFYIICAEARPRVAVEVANANGGSF